MAVNRLSLNWESDFSGCQLKIAFLFVDEVQFDVELGLYRKTLLVGWLQKLSGNLLVLKIATFLVRHNFKLFVLKLSNYLRKTLSSCLFCFLASLLNLIPELNWFRLVYFLATDSAIKEAVVIKAGYSFGEVHLVGIVVVDLVLLVITHLIRVWTSGKTILNSYLCLPELSYQGPCLHLCKIFPEVLKNLVLELSPFDELVFVHNNLALDVYFLRHRRLFPFVEHLGVVSHFYVNAIPEF